jgi:hypothetical protein
MTVTSTVSLPRSLGPVHITSEQLLRSTAILMIIFYPFKGLLNIPFFFVFDDKDSANYLTPVIALGVLGLASLTFLANTRKHHISKLDFILLLIGLPILLIAFVREDFIYAKIGMLIFVFPVLLANLVHGSDKFFKQAFFVFFLLVTVYIAGEHLLLHTHLYGITDQVFISQQTLASYQDALAFGSSYNDVFDQLIDYRFSSTPWGDISRVRTGGFLANALSMPVLMCLASTFFYIRYRQSGSVILLMVLLVSIFNLFNSLSTANVLAFLITVLFYEAYGGRGPSKFIVPLILLALAGVVVIIFEPASYLFARFTDLFESTTMEFTSRQGFSLLAVPRTIIGWHGWSNRSNFFYSENDIINLVTAVGLVPSFFIFKRLLGPITSIRSSDNGELKLYATIVLSAVLAMVHTQAVFSVNVFMIVILMNMKCYAILSAERDPIRHTTHHLPSQSFLPAPHRTSDKEHYPTGR